MGRYLSRFGVRLGQVSLLTREQEVEISKRIEDAEAMVQKHISRFGFVARAHLDLTRKLLEGRERFDRVILDKKIESRERYMKNLPRLCKQVEKFSASITQQFCDLARNSSKKRSQKLRALQRRMTSLQRIIRSFTSSRELQRNLCTWRTTRTTHRFTCEPRWRKILAVKKGGCSFRTRSATWKRTCGFHFLIMRKNIAC